MKFTCLFPRMNCSICFKIGMLISCSKIIRMEIKTSSKHGPGSNSRFRRGFGQTPRADDENWLERQLSKSMDSITQIYPLCRLPQQMKTIETHKLCYLFSYSAYSCIYYVVHIAENALIRTFEQKRFGDHWLSVLHIQHNWIFVTSKECQVFLRFQTYN